MKKIAVFGLFLAMLAGIGLLIGCEGPTGPEGPAGLDGYSEYIEKGVFDIQLETLDWGHTAVQIIVDMETEAAAEDYRFLAPADVLVLTTHRHPTNEGNPIVNNVDRVRRAVDSVTVDGKYLKLNFSKIFLGSTSTTTHNALTGGRLVLMEYEVYIRDSFNNKPAFKPAQRNVLEDPRAADFEIVIHEYNGTKNGFRAYLPNATGMPLIVNLGEGGVDCNQLFNNMGGFGYYDWAKLKGEDIIIIAGRSSVPDPDAPGGTISGIAQSAAGRATLINYIQSLITSGKADPERIYISGYSNNGNELWNYLCEYPAMWAAALPITPHTAVDADNVNGNATRRATDISSAGADFPIWMVVDKLDTANPPANTYSNPDRTQVHYDIVMASYTSLTEAGLTKVYYTILSGVYDRYGTLYDGFGLSYSHWAWLTVYNNRNYKFLYPAAHFDDRSPFIGNTGEAGIIDWLFAQSK
jgi:hypothetical protein